MKVAACSLLFFLLLSGTGQTTSRNAEKTTAGKGKDFVCEIQPREIAPGGVAVLKWSIKGATRVVIQASSDSQAGALREIARFDGASGELEVKPKESTTYVIMCEGSTTYVCASASVRVRVKRK